MATLARPIGLGLAARGDLDDVVQWARRARDLGLDSLWIHDSYYERDAISFTSAVAAGLAADHDDSGFRVAVGAVNPFTRHPVVLAMTGHVAWLVALGAAAAHVAYGALTAAAATVAMAGTAALGVALVGRGKVPLGVLLAAAGLAGVAPPGLGWTAFAAAWTGVAFLLVIDFAGRSPSTRGTRLAG